MATSATAATESATAAAVKHVTGGEDNYEPPAAESFDGWTLVIALGPS
jgi:hypothetical protein